MTNKNIGILAVVLVVAVLGVGAMYFSNQQAPLQKAPSQSYNPQTQGKVIFGITDAAASMENISSVVVTVNKIEMHSQAEGWITVSNATSQYDLLALKQSGMTSLLAQADVAAGTYDQTRLMISKVVVTQSGVQSEAKLPSGELKIMGTVVVNSDKTSTVVFDFIADKSLHVTGNGKFIFVPVIALETRSDASAQVKSDGNININGGKVEFSGNAGMDINGEMKKDFMVDSKVKLDLESNGVLKVSVGGEDDKSVKVAALGAINTAVSGGYLDSAISVTLVTQNGKKEWLVSGLKNLMLASVRIDATTGAVINSNN